MAKSYRICTRCIMDTSDPDIVFNDNGVCNHCHRFDTYVQNNWFPNKRGKLILEAIVAKIKKEGRNNKYDSIMGLSGGADSSYMAYLVKKLGLRPLVVHVDGGWNSEESVRNIENIVKKLDFDLYTFVVNWEEMKDLQLAFLRSGVASQDTPQDHAFFAALYNFATQNKIRYVLSGSNFATESILPQAWGHTSMDLRHLKAIHRRFGKKKLHLYPTVGFFNYYIYYSYVRGMRVVCPLNYVPYEKADAIEVLKKHLDWKPYGAKHHESLFTRFLQTYYLPRRFGYEKKRAHLASLVVSGQMTRDDALIEMSRPALTEQEMQEDKEYVSKKLGLSIAMFDELLTLPPRDYRDFPSNHYLLKLKDTLAPILRSRR